MVSLFTKRATSRSPSPPLISKKPGTSTAPATQPTCQSSLTPSVEEVPDPEAGGAPQDRKPQNSQRIIESDEEDDDEDVEIVEQELQAKSAENTHAEVKKEAGESRYRSQEIQNLPSTGQIN